MEASRTPVTKKNLFAAGILMIAGALNSYSNNMYNVVAGAHTGDLTKMSANLANGKWDAAANNGLMILFCIIGVLIDEVLKHNYRGKGDWRKAALVINGAGLALLSFAGDESPAKLMSYFCSLLCGLMLNMFRDCLAGSYNSTIATGNMRTLGQYLYEAADPRAKGDWKRFLSFFGLMASYASGAVLITFCCRAAAYRASLLPAAASIAMALVVLKDEKKAA